VHCPLRPKLIPSPAFPIWLFSVEERGKILGNSEIPGRSLRKVEKKLLPSDQSDTPLWYGWVAIVLLRFERSLE
jgi:hypothetical protein